MSIETKEEILDRITNIVKPNCPHCNKEMQLWEVPPINVGDGLGWGVPFLFMCFNDDCKLYKSGWVNLMENYAHNASYRCINFPGTDQFELMPVFSPVGASGQIISDLDVAEQEVLKSNIKRGFSILTDCYVNKDEVSILGILMDIAEPLRVRIKAAEMIGEIGPLDITETMRSINSYDSVLDEAITLAVNKIYDRFFVCECRFCAEIIKKRANICKHCHKDLVVI